MPSSIAGPLHLRAAPAPARAPESDRIPTAFVLAALAQAVVFGASCLFDGYYDFVVWASLTLVSASVLVALFLVEPPRPARPVVALLAMIVVLTAWAAISVTWSESAENAWREVHRVAFYGVSVAITVTAVRSWSQARLVIGTLTGLLMVVVVWIVGGLLTSGGTELFLEHRLAEPMGYVNGEAALLLMAFWACLALAERSRRRLVAALGCGFAVASLDLLLMTQARAVVPALLVSLVLVMALAGGRLRRGILLCVVAGAASVAAPAALAVYSDRGQSLIPATSQLRTAGAMLVAAVLLAAAVWLGLRQLAQQRPPRRAVRRGAGAILLALPFILVTLAMVVIDDPTGKVRDAYEDFVDQRVSTTSTSRFVSGGGYRYDLWRVAVLDARRNPLTGVGAGNYPTTFQRERRSPQFVRQPHSVELQALAELGIPGLLMLLGVFGAGGWILVAASRRAEPYLVVATTGIVTVWLVQTSVDWLHNLPGVTGVAIVALGSMAGPLGQGERSRRGRAGRLVTVVLMCGLTLLAASVGRQLAAEVYRQRASNDLASDPSAALADAERALKLDSALLEASYTKAAALARLNDYRGARTALLDAAAAEPHNYVPYVLLGDLATRRGDSAAARRSYARADALNPFDARLPAVQP